MSKTSKITVLSVITLVVAVFLLLQYADLPTVREVNDSAATSTSVATTTKTSSTTKDTSESAKKTVFSDSDYIEVVDGCGPYFGGECLRVHATPSTDGEVVSRLRNGQVLKVSESLISEGRRWYKVVFNEWLRHPDRIKNDWYVAAEFVWPVTAEVGDWEGKESPEPDKRIVIDLSEQTLYAYDGEVIFLETAISTGLVEGPTRPGEHTVFYKTPSRYMQGPIPGVTEDEYDLPGVPWNLYFTRDGSVIHGAYWHDHFGINWSHGCVNLPTDKAEELYRWTPEGTVVSIQE